VVQNVAGCWKVLQYQFSTKTGSSLRGQLSFSLCSYEYITLNEFQGNVFAGHHLLTGHDVIVKAEYDPEHQREFIKPTLPFEAAMYECIGPAPSIASMHWIGHVDNWNALIKEKLGPDLAMLKKFCLDKLLLKTDDVSGSDGERFVVCTKNRT
jgi:hypothetical protein